MLRARASNVWGVPSGRLPPVRARQKTRKRSPNPLTTTYNPPRVRWVRFDPTPSALDLAANFKRLTLPSAKQPKPKSKRIPNPPNNEAVAIVHEEGGQEPQADSLEPYESITGDIQSATVEGLKPRYRRRRARYLRRRRQLQKAPSPHPPSPTRALRDYLAAINGFPRNPRVLSRYLSKTSDRLPVLTATALLKQRLAQGNMAPYELELMDHVVDDEKWAPRMRKREIRGISEDDINHWAWILSAETADLAIQRCISDPRLKPPFVLCLLVGGERTIKDPEGFCSFLRYIRKHYIAVPREPDGLSGFDLTWNHFRRLLGHIVDQCLSSWPALLPSVARLAASFIEGLPQQMMSSSALHRHATQFRAFNTCLQLLGSPADVYPLKGMINNWQAQKILLDMASRLQLSITREGYRSVRRVLVALPKSTAERDITERAAVTWPPFRQDFDGRDEQRRPEDSLSFAAKVGVLKREAGYPDDHFDRTVDTLAGSVMGRAPTIQSRFLVPPPWQGKRASQNIDMEWAAKVKTTRNAREAWQMFSSTPLPGVKPSAEVYAAMFEKLFAVKEPLWSRILPGEANSTFPVYDRNLSALEIARITPPTPEELYRMMIFSGVKPTGELLIVLLRHASSKEVALQYLADSPYRDHVQLLQGTTFKSPDCVDLLPALPVRVFYAWIFMLCNTQTKPRRRARYHFASNQVKEAMRLATEYQLWATGLEIIDKAPWYIIMEYLAGRGNLYSEEGAKYNTLVTLNLFMFHWQRTADLKGIDSKLFELLCVVLRKALRLSTWQSTSGEIALRVMPVDRNGRVTRLLLDGFLKLRATFRILTRPIQGLDESEGASEPIVYPYRITSKHLGLYMRVLGTIGDGKEMVRLMRWILEAWDCNYVLEDARQPGELAHDDMVRTFRYFSRMGMHLIEPTVMQDLEEELAKFKWEKNCTWVSPIDQHDAHDDEVDLDLGAGDCWQHVKEMIYEREGEDTQERQLDEAKSGELAEG
ncbi:hypothetical protein B0T16DRAFT_130224 [Cercophora newfieldiana]|uniref:Uncharacterized protein n=1 Tax=Cercophora newfieldiana TaxID=92897 RepID=A0AA39YB57_9PEZI|nr:hypothetical protein B0T16DRAFT_130224 [Cercophora newfieldiana]